ncbi:MAG: Hsp20/alpha crystallin family protein [Anaerolineales bacterium]|nr:Hsp20/alpha crystallin family protein [Anaerolineales bacterium]
MTNEIKRWEPFREMISLREAMDRLFEDSFVKPGARQGSILQEGSLAIDIFEKKDKLVVQVAVPGINPDDLDITIEGELLNIKGEHKQEEEIKEENYYRREFRSGSFSRSVRLPIEVDPDKADATCKDGILTLTFPKPKKRKALSIPVAIKK